MTGERKTHAEERRDEFWRAVDALVAAGFTKNRAMELLTCRWELRDSFAAKAMAAHITRIAVDASIFVDNNIIADAAYSAADAMLVARKPQDRP